MSGVSGAASRAYPAGVLGTSVTVYCLCLDEFSGTAGQTHRLLCDCGASAAQCASPAWYRRRWRAQRPFAPPQATAGFPSPAHRRGRYVQLVCHGVQPRDHRRLPKPRPAAEPRARVDRHQHRRRKTVGKLLDTAAARLSRLLQVLGRHRVPGQDMKQLVRQVEMAPALHLKAGDRPGPRRFRTADATTPPGVSAGPGWLARRRLRARGESARWSLPGR